MIVGEAGSDERLRRIEAVTDAALSRLDVDDLLNELLERVRELLVVDTAVVLLVDVHAQQLVTTAAKGLEEEVRQGFRLSIGRGFGGQVAREKRPVVVDELTPAHVVSPSLRQKGLSSLAGVPIFADDEVIGVLHVGSLRPREFTADEVQLLELVADRASLAVQARTNRIDRTAALALQRSLLPALLPEISGVEMAARYVPGHDSGVGGDWYDVFVLPSGWLGVVVGDVSGHGLRSAVVMGRLRSALRAYALISADPAEALSHLDQKVQHFETGSLATVLYAMLPPDRGSIHVSLAGHPPPLVAGPDGSAEITKVPADFPLGLAPRPNVRHTTVIDFPPGSVIVCYTDGLIERRGELIDVGMARVRDAYRPARADDVCAALMASTGTETPNDDIAVLTIRRPGTPAIPTQHTRASVGLTLVAAAFDGGGVSALRRRVRAAVDTTGLGEVEAADFVTAVNEVMTNAVRHGGGGADLRLFRDAADHLVCEVRDRGTGFPAGRYLARTKAPTPSSTGGMGLWIAQQTSDDLEIESGPDGTMVRLTARTTAPLSS